MLLAWLWLLLTAHVPARAEKATSFDVAITVDDLPWTGSDQGPRTELPSTSTARLLAAFQQRGIVATGYVNCDRVQPDAPILHQWIAAGMSLGNHQAAHDNINKVPEAQWQSGVRRCHEMLAEVTGKPPGTFRFPYLYNGEGAQKRDRIQAWLTGEFGYTIARVTADNHEWLLSRFYGKAKAGSDVERTTEIATYYVAHIRQSLTNARAVAREKLGRDVAHVLLLHANELGADHVGEVLDALQADGARFVSVEVALADPVYARSNSFEGWGGISWLYRIAPVSTSTPWDDHTLEEIRARFGAK